MENLKLTAQKVLNLLKDGGADMAQCVATYKEKREFNVDGGEFSLFRTTFDNSLVLTAFKGGKKGTISINRLDDEAIKAAVSDCIASCDSAVADEAWEIASTPDSRRFEEGCVTPDLDKFFDRLRELMENIKDRHPLILMEQLIASHVKTDSLYLNSFGVEYETVGGAYSVDLMYSAHDGERGSSFFGSGVVFDSLEKPIIELASIERDLSDVEKQVDTRPLEGKFEGTLIAPPSSLASFLYYALSNFAGDSTLLDGTSIWKDALGTAVADERLTISMNPLDERIVCGDRYTGEGYIAENYDVIKNGVLNSFMLSQYIANKTGLKRAPNDTFSVVIEGGDVSLDEIIKNTKKGIIVGRFSGGQPGTNGEFSGVAKNSFLVEDGKITSAVSETMINGNLADILKNISAISSETVCDGTSVLPYIAFEGVTVSGK